MSLSSIYDILSSLLSSVKDFVIGSREPSSIASDNKGDAHNIIGIQGDNNTVHVFKEDLKAEYPGKPQIEFDPANVVFARNDSPENARNGCWGIGFAYLKVINATSEPLAIKKLELCYEIDGGKDTVDSSVVHTASIYSPREKGISNHAIITYENTGCFVGNWDNFRQVVSRREQALSPGDVLSGSLYFVLGFKEFEKINRLSNVHFVLADYAGGSTVQPVQISDDIKSRLDARCVLRDRQDYCDDLERKCKKTGS